MPRSSKRASERQSATSSRSPCTTWIAIAVCPSWKVVNSCARAVGIVLLRGMIRSTSPPMVSRPSESGITSSSSTSAARGVAGERFGLDRRADARRPRPGRGRSAAAGRRARPPPRCTSGMRVEPPTRTTPSTSPRLDLGVAQQPGARRRASDRRTAGRRASSSARVDRQAERLGRRAVQANVTRGRRLDSASFAARAATMRGAPVGRRLGGRRRPCASAQSASAASMSSPPSAESPPVATTSNTPCGQAQQRDVEGAAAEVVDGVEAFGAVVQPVGDGGRGRLADQAQHVQPGELAPRPWWPGAGRRRSTPAR